MFKLCRFNPDDASDLAAFLNDLRQNHWTLTSFAYERKPEQVPLVTAEGLIGEDRQPNRTGTFLLKRNGHIISMLQVDDKYGDGRVAVFWGAETHPKFQRRGIFWRSLGIPCIRKICNTDCERIDAITWTFNRKGIPVYKRMGFRAVPDTSLIMENYLPLILHHPSSRTYFDRYDYIRTLQNSRSYGYDAVELDGLSVFEYWWKSREKELKVLIDWQRKQIASIQRLDWAVWCFVIEETPFRIHCQIENRMQRDLTFRLHHDQIRNGDNSMQVLPKDVVVAGDIEIQDPLGATVPRVLIELDIGGERVPFPIRRLQEVAEKSSTCADYSR